MMFGIAASLVTPNRIGEYPARIIQLKEHNSTRLLSVSVLGACSQMLALMIAGVAGLIFYYLSHPEAALSHLTDRHYAFHAGAYCPLFLL